MINDHQIKFWSQLIDRHVSEFVKCPLFPTNTDARMQFFITLRSCNQGREGAAMIPGDTAELCNPAHAFCRIKAPLSIRLFLIGRIFSQRFVCADSQAASMISIEARPNSPGEPFRALPRMASIKFCAGDWPG